MARCYAARFRLGSQYVNDRATTSSAERLSFGHGAAPGGVSRLAILGRSLRGQAHLTKLGARGCPDRRSPAAAGSRTSCSRASGPGSALTLPE
jgi:hypothetical protein